MGNEFSLSEHIRNECARWAKDKSLNPANCNIEIHSVYPGKAPSEYQISFDVTYSYSVWIQALLTPFYILFGILSIYEGIEYLEDIAYFKRLTPGGFRKKRAMLAETKTRFYDLILKEARVFKL